MDCVMDCVNFGVLLSMILVDFLLSLRNMCFIVLVFLCMICLLMLVELVNVMRFICGFCMSILFVMVGLFFVIMFRMFVGNFVVIVSFLKIVLESGVLGVGLRMIV